LESTARGKGLCMHLSDIPFKQTNLGKIRQIHMTNGRNPKVNLRNT
jgi:hypothetical protein